MTIDELRRRIELARTPSIATEDALTVALLHDLIIEWSTARAELYAAPPPRTLDERRRIHMVMRRRVDAAEDALDLIAGVEP